MIPKNTSRIILLLLKDMAEHGYNVNQVSKELEISIGSSFKILKSLKEEELVYDTKIGNGIFYKLNFQSRETVKLCEILLIQERKQLAGGAKLYAQNIEDFDAEMIILFGSILTSKTYNDIDVMFLTQKVKKVNEFCLNISKIRTKPLVPLIIKKQDLINELKNKKKSVLNIMQGVVLKGESVYVEVIKNVNS